MTDHETYLRLNHKTHRIPPSRKKRYMLKRFRVEVYQNGKLVATVKRALNVQRTNSCYWLPGSKDAKGNRPFIIQYDKKMYAAQSKAGDLSDPLERDDSFLDSLFIEIGADTRVLPRKFR